MLNCAVFIAVNNDQYAALLANAPFIWIQRGFYFIYLQPHRHFWPYRKCDDLITALPRNFGRGDTDL